MAFNYSHRLEGPFRVVSNEEAHSEILFFDLRDH